MKNCLYLVYMLLFAFQAHLDARREEISVWTDLFLFLTGTCLSVLENRSWSDYLMAVTFLPLVLYLLSKTGKLGEGDAEIMAACGALLSYREQVFLFFLSTLILAVYACIRKKDRYPLVPFLFLSFCILSLCRMRHRCG